MSTFSQRMLPALRPSSIGRIKTTQHSSTARFSRFTKPLPTRTLPANPRLECRSRFQQAAQSKQQKRYRQAFNYRQFQQSQSLLKRWAAGKYFYHQIAGITFIGGTYYVTNLEEVPVSHRRRFRNISFETEASMGKQLYQEVLSQYGQAILPETHPYTRMVQRVAERLIPHCGLANEDWAVYVIDSPEMNAFVIPGGKIFVFKGMFDVCKTDDSLAAVIGHEIGHNVAHHAAERASAGNILTGLAFVLYFITGVDFGLQGALLNLVFLNPGSRTQESEADYIGLLMMSEACYDPRAAMEMWNKMESLEKYGIPQWLSTHPSNHNRMEKIREWLPQADDKFQHSGCGVTSSYANDFWSQTAQPNK